MRFDRFNNNSKLRHPNIVQFLGACLNPDYFCLLTEYMEKGSLFHVLQKEPNLPISLRIQIATDIAKGMVYLHTRNPPIVHRDIKSLNILVCFSPFLFLSIDSLFSTDCERLESDYH